jgi:hypothetical protein
MAFGTIFRAPYATRLNAEFQHPRVWPIAVLGDNGALQAGSFIMRRMGAFFISTWLAAAILFLGRHSVPMIALSGVVAFAGLDIFRP